MQATHREALDRAGALAIAAGEPINARVNSLEFACIAVFALIRNARAPKCFKEFALIRNACAEPSLFPNGNH